MIEDIPDHRRILNTADNPHGPVTSRTDQGICFVYFLNKPGPTFPESLFVSLRFEDAGYGVIQTFLLAFSSRDVAVVTFIDVYSNSAKIALALFMSLAWVDLSPPQSRKNWVREVDRWPHF